MKKIVFILSLILISAYITTADTRTVLTEGTYKCYYPEELQEGAFPRTNTIFSNGMGVFKDNSDGDSSYIEKYLWAIEDDTLILANYEVTVVDAGSGDILDTDVPYFQYFKILEHTDRRIQLSLNRDLFIDGSFIEYDSSDDEEPPYIWELIDPES